ncbi:MAG: hypothetical protein OXH39_05835 [Candidatus Poribacteria bacterium]|nr:hypothetical protein [Candidatus Poribacteria bacterium]
MEAQSILTNPRRRISAEVAWLPGINQILTNGFLNLLERSAELRMELFHKLITFMENVNETGYEQSLFGNEKLIPLSRANLFAAGLSRVHDHLPDDIGQWSGYIYRSSPPTTVQWILEIAKAFDGIEMKELCITINEERRESGFPEITNLSIIEDELQNRRHYYQQVINLALKDLSIWELAKAVTIGIKTATSNGEKHGPILIDDLVIWYENHIQGSIENVELKINIHIEDIRSRAVAKQTDSNLGFIINELIRTVKEWNVLAQPIQVSKKSRGERHNASFEMVGRFNDLAAALFFEYRKPDFSRKILNTLKDIFSEVPEIVEQIVEILRELETQIGLVIAIESFENIKAQVEQLKEASDAKQSDYTLTPMVNQLIQSVKSWDTATQPVEANSGVAFTVREVALHLCNKHRKIDFAIQITNALIGVFNANSVGVEVVTRLTEDKAALVAMKNFENINTQVEQLKEASDAKQSDYTLSPMVNQLIQSVKSWNTTAQTVDANNGVAFTVRNIALHLWNEHQKLDFAIQITNALIGVFKGVYGMDEVNNRLKEDIMTLYAMNIQRRRTIEPPQKRGGTGCLLQIVIFAILALIAAFSQGC